MKVLLAILAAAAGLFVLTPTSAEAGGPCYRPPVHHGGHHGGYYHRPRVHIQYYRRPVYRPVYRPRYYRPRYCAPPRYRYYGCR